jgi:nitroreductase
LVFSVTFCKNILSKELIMKFIELAKKRVSVRGYTAKPVSDEILNEVLEAGRLAPTAKNLQPFQFVVVCDQAGLAALAKGYAAPWFAEAPVVIAICVEPSKGWTRDRTDGKNYCEIDAAIAADHMTLAATDLGLGTCWVGAFDPAVIREALALPAGIEPLILLTLGQPDDEGRPKTRKPLDELVRYEKWSDSGQENKSS